MAIANTEFYRMPVGNRIEVAGKSVLSGGTNTGDVVTGLNYVEVFLIDTNGSGAKATAVNETLQLSGGDVTIVSESNDATVYWTARGHA